MRNKLIVVSLLAMSMLIALSFISAATKNSNIAVKEKASPLYKIRISKTLDEKIDQMREKIQTRFSGRLFFLPNLFKNRDSSSPLDQFSRKHLTNGICMTQRVPSRCLLCIS